MIAYLMAEAAGNRTFIVYGAAGEVLGKAATLAAAMALAKMVGAPTRIVAGGAN